MHPVKGIFNMSEYNEGGKTTLIQRMYNHRAALK